jgi:predicted nuclease of predicted toxin-antitoxin system
MLKLAADENFNGRILRGLLRRDPDIDIIRIQDTEAYQAGDPEMLEWAANQGRIILTHDIRTVTKFANERIREGKPMPGIFEVSQSAPIGRVIEDLLLLAVASSQDEWEGRTLYIPL